MQINTLLKLSLKILLFLKVAITLSFPFGINSVTSVEVKIFSNFFSSDFFNILDKSWSAIDKIDGKNSAIVTLDPSALYTSPSSRPI